MTRQGLRDSSAWRWSLLLPFFCLCQNYSKAHVHNGRFLDTNGLLPFPFQVSNWRHPEPFPKLSRIWSVIFA